MEGGGKGEVTSEERWDETNRGGTGRCRKILRVHIFIAKPSQARPGHIHVHTIHKINQVRTQNHSELVRSPFVRLVSRRRSRQFSSVEFSFSNGCRLLLYFSSRVRIRFAFPFPSFLLSFVIWVLLPQFEEPNPLNDRHTFSSADIYSRGAGSRLDFRPRFRTPTCKVFRVTGNPFSKLLSLIVILKRILHCIRGAAGPTKPLLYSVIPNTEYILQCQSVSTLRLRCRTYLDFFLETYIVVFASDE